MEMMLVLSNFMLEGREWLQTRKHEKHDVVQDDLDDVGCPRLALFSPLRSFPSLHEPNMMFTKNNRAFRCKNNNLREK